MIPIEQRAENTLKILSEFITTILPNGAFKKIYSENVGNLEDRLHEDKEDLEKNLYDFRFYKRKNKRKPGSYKAQYDQAEDGLRATLSDIDRLWTEEIFAKLRNDISILPQKINKKEVDVKEENKQDVLDKVKETVGIADKIISSGKKVWELVTEHKEVFASIAKFLPWVL